MPLIIDRKVWLCQMLSVRKWLSLEIPQWELVDNSDPFYNRGLKTRAIPPTAVGGCFRSFLQPRPPSAAIVSELERPRRKDLKHPPASAGGIQQPCTNGE